MILVEPSAYKRLGTLEYNGWHIVAYRIPHGFSISAFRDNIQKDTMRRESLSDAWRALKPHLA